MDEPRLSHVDETGEARMVDVSGKQATRPGRSGRSPGVDGAGHPPSSRRSRLFPRVTCSPWRRSRASWPPSGPRELVPLCHPIALTQVDLTFTVAEEEARIDIECVTRTEDRTGVEMEALVGASVAAITIYDMCKAVDRGMVIGDIRLLEKTGGKEDYVRPAEKAAAPAAAGAAVPAVPLAVQPATPPAGTVVAVNVSESKGERKKAAAEVMLRAGARDRGRRSRRPLASAGQPAGAGIHRQDDRRRTRCGPG